MKDEVPITIISGDTIIKGIEEDKKEVNGKFVIRIRMPKGLIGNTIIEKPAVDKAYYRRYNVIRCDGSVSKNEHAIVIDQEKGQNMLEDKEYENLKQTNDELNRQLNNLSNTQIKNRIAENNANNRDKTMAESERLADYNERMRKRYFFITKEKD
jgi:hypothetical protein